MIIRTSPFGTPRPRRHRAPYYRPLTLIQAWLRCLPDDLWASVRPQLNAALSGGGEAPPPPQPGKAGEEGEAAAGPLALMRRLPARERALCEWVVDVMAVVVAREAHNRMGVDAIAVVIAPNLLRPPDTPDPAAMLGFTQQSVEFVEALLAEHMGAGAPAEGRVATADEGRAASAAPGSGGEAPCPRPGDAPTAGEPHTAVGATHEPQPPPGPKPAPKQQSNRRRRSHSRASKAASAPVSPEQEAAAAEAAAAEAEALREQVAALQARLQASEVRDGAGLDPSAAQGVLVPFPRRSR